MVRDQWCLEDFFYLLSEPKVSLFGHIYLFYKDVVFFINCLTLKGSLTGEHVQSFPQNIAMDPINQGLYGNRLEQIFHIQNFLVKCFRYALVLSSSCCVMVKNLNIIVLASMFMLKWEVSLVQLSQKSIIEPNFSLWYYAQVDPQNIVKSILYIAPLSCITGSRLLHVFCMCSLGSISPLQLFKSLFSDMQS